VVQSRICWFLNAELVELGMVSRDIHNAIHTQLLARGKEDVERPVGGATFVILTSCDHSRPVQFWAGEMASLAEDEDVSQNAPVA